MRPGMSVRPRQSITSAFAALTGFAETSRIVSSSTSTETPPSMASARGSSSAAFLNRVCAIRHLLGREAGDAGEREDHAIAVFRLQPGLVSCRGTENLFLGTVVWHT